MGVVLRGRAGGLKSNKRQLWQAPLRREPTLGVKLSLADKVGVLVSQWGSRDAAPRWATASLEQDSGWLWRVQLRQWYEQRETLGKQCAKLKIGSHGLRPFGSCAPLSKRKSQSMGCRLRDGESDTYQSEVVATLK